MASGMTGSRRGPGTPSRDATQNTPTPPAVAPPDDGAILRAPTKLWGREGELEQLATALVRARSGKNALVLVEGAPGIGKSALVEEFHRRSKESAHEGRPPLFASGKCDLQSRAPYGALGQVVLSFVLAVLSEGPNEVARTKAALAQLLGADLDVLTSILPRTQILFGAPKSSVVIENLNTPARFMTAIVAFVRYFAVEREPGRPCVLYVDDLQWCDEHTVRILDAVLSDDRMSHLLMVCSFRTNEIPKPLEETIFGLPTFKSAERITIAGLSPHGLNDFLSDAVDIDTGDTSTLAAMLTDKAAGNPLHIMEILRFLHHNNSLRLRGAGESTPGEAGAPRSAASAGVARGWDTHLDMGDVKELLAQRMQAMGLEVVTVLASAAMIGSTINVVVLHSAVALPADVMYATLARAADAGMLERLPQSPGEEIVGVTAEFKYRFMHDKVREAALTLQPERRQQNHVAIAQALLAALPTAERQGTATASQSLFDICDHLNAVDVMMAESPEAATGPWALTKELRQSAAELNVVAGKAAHKLVAFSAALNYIQMARVHGVMVTRLDRPEDAALAAGELMWRHLHGWAMELALEEITILLQLGDVKAGEAVMEEGSKHARSDMERAQLMNARIYSNVAKLDDSVNVVAMGRTAIAMLGSPLPSLEEQAEYTDRVYKKHQLRDLDAVVRFKDLPLCTDAHTLLLSDLLCSYMWTVYLADSPRLPGICALAWDIAASKGMNKWLAAPMAMHCVVLANQGEFALAGRISDAVRALCTRYGFRAQEPEVLAIMAAAVLPWYMPLPQVQQVIITTREASQEIGNYNFVAYSDLHRHTTEIAQGLPLHDMMTAIPEHMTFARTAKNALTFGMMLVDFRYCAKMAYRDQYPDAYKQYLDKVVDVQSDADFETRAQEILYTTVTHNTFQSLYHLVYDEPELALARTATAEPLLVNIVGTTSVAVHAFVQSMAHLRTCRAGDSLGAEAAAKVEERRKQLVVWAEAAPFSYRAMLLLIEFELARIKKSGQRVLLELAAEAITVATRSNILHVIGLAHEVVARYWREIIPGEMGDAYAASHIEMAIAAYTSFGAHAKVALLAPQHAQPQVRGGSMTIYGTQFGDQLDAMFLLRASQAIASELRPARLLEIALPILMEASGAEHACLLTLTEEGTFTMDANSTAALDLSNPPPFLGLNGGARVEASHLLLPLINLVGGTCKDMIIADATQDNYFFGDEYVRQWHPRSILCACLFTRKGHVSKLLYMENNQYPGAFTDRQLKFVKLLLNQMAISLETARMCADLEDTSKALTGEVEKRTLTQNAVAAAAATESQKALQARQRYLADVVHDLRTPMNAVVSLGQLLLDTPLDDAQREHVTAIKRTGEQITRQITSILDISKLDASKMTLELEPTELRLCVRDCCALARAELSESNMTITTAVDDTVPWSVLTDGFRFRQILNIVLGLTQTNGIAISVSAVGANRPASLERVAFPQAYNPDMLPWREITCRLRDTGDTPRERAPEGTPRMHRLAEEGEGAEVETSAKKNSNLSMMIARSLLELMGGSMTTPSDADSDGAFTFTFACAMLQERPAVAPVTHEVVLRILVVEPYESDRRMVAKHLRFLGHIAETANNVGDAAAVARDAARFDVILMVPSEARGAFLAQQHAHGVRCVGMLAPHETIEAEQLAQFDEVLYKPVKLADVMSMLRSIPQVAQR